MRQWIRATLVTVALAGGMTFLPAGPAAACSCGATTDAQALTSADVVFSGELIEVRTPPGVSYSSADPERFVFAVERVYKGDASAQQSVVTEREGASCGLELTGRGPFLVFAYTDAVHDFDIEVGEVYSNLCNGSRAISDAPVPVEFGDGTPPAAGASPIGSPDDGGIDVMPFVAAGAGALALAGGWMAFRRWRTRRPAPSPG